MTEQNLTLSLVIGALLLAVFCGWRGAKKSNPFKGPRMIPWRTLMLILVTASLLGLVHYVDLLRGI